MENIKNKKMKKKRKGHTKIRFVGKTFAGLNGTVTGWGAVQEAGAISQTLQEVKVPILTNTECRASNYPSRRITDNMLCAGYQEGKKDSCQVMKEKFPSSLMLTSFRLTTHTNQIVTSLYIFCIYIHTCAKFCILALSFNNKQKNVSYELACLLCFYFYFLY